MTDQTIPCPKCGNEIPLTETLAAPFVAAAQARFEADATQREAKLEAEAKARAAEVAAKEAGILVREKLLRDAQAKVAQDREAFDEQLRAAKKLAREEADKHADDRLKSEKARIELEAKKRADEAAATQLKAVQDDLAAKSAKLAEAQALELQLRRDKQTLAEDREAFELDKQRAIDEARAKIKDETRKAAEEEFRLKSADKDKVIEDQRKQLAEAQRKLEQGSQQLQGEVQELELEAILGARFPMDRIEPVPKGHHGGDLLHRINGPLGQSCGTILWESKRTKNWTAGWTGKARDNQRVAKCEVAVIVSQALPDGIETFGDVDGVWVVAMKLAIPVATVLRQSLVELAMARQAGEGQQTKMELVYQYMTGQRFRQRVEAIVEAFSSMQSDLDAEKRAIQKQWAKREAQIDRLMQNTVGMYGDLQGIAGKTLQEIEGLEMKALGATMGSTEGG